MIGLIVYLLFFYCSGNSLLQIFTILNLYTMATQERRLPLGKIEPNSLKYFLSCGVGGIIGMSKAPPPSQARANNIFL